MSAITEIRLERIERGAYFINIYETDYITLGFTEGDFPLQELPLLLNCKDTPIKELKQVHSNRVYLSSHLKEGEETKGDGIVLDRPETFGVIKTADCIPLFTWNDGATAAAVVHVGWRGLLKGIEQRTLQLLDKTTARPDRKGLNILLGPAIEQKCYEVGTDLYDAFAGKHYRGHIFSPLDGKKGKYLMDVKKGLVLSLQGLGIRKEQITDCGLCTFCLEERFPSYRRDPFSKGRIYSFMLLKGNRIPFRY